MDVTSLIYIDVFDPRGRGDWTNPGSDGTFEVKVRPGEYEVSIWIDPALGGYADFNATYYRVGKNAVDIGEIDFIEFSSTISGKLLTDKGAAIFGAEVWAWSHEGGWASTTTGSDGSYTLKVAPGRWEVGYDFISTEGDAPPYIVQPPKRVRIKGDGEQKELNFRAREAGAIVSGVVVSDGKPVVDLDAWVYAKEFMDIADDGDEYQFDRVVAEVPLSTDGTFSFPAVPGSYMVGIWLPPGSDYDFPEEAFFSVELDENDKIVLSNEEGIIEEGKAEFKLTSISTKLSGNFKDGSKNLTGLTGEVYAMRVDGNGWRYTNIENDGSYEMKLPKGAWLVDYFIEYDENDAENNFPPHPPQPIRIIVDGDETEHFDLSKVDKISSVISGEVTGADFDPNASSVYVWAYREENRNLPEFWNEVETDENGSFEIPILPGGRYEVGVYLPEDLRDEGFLDAPVQTFRLKTDDNQTGVVFELVIPADDNFIAGTVFNGNGEELAGAFVYAYNKDGLELETVTEEDGSFLLKVTSGSIWRVGGDYSEYDADGNITFFLPENEIDADLREYPNISDLEITLIEPDFVLPDSTSVTFDPSKDFVTRLPDGAELTILGGSANVDYETVDKVKLVVTPTARVSRDAEVKTADYAYSIELFNGTTGKKIEGEFKQDVIITIPVDIEALEENDLDVENLEGKYYDGTKTPGSVPKPHPSMKIVASLP